MRFTAIALGGVGAILLWAAIKGENPVQAAQEAIRGGGDPTDHPNPELATAQRYSGMDASKVRSDVPRNGGPT